MSLVLLSFFIVSSPLSDILEKSVEKVEWSSLQHDHIYDNLELKKAYQASAYFYFNNPQKFKQEIETLSPAQRLELVYDDLNSRTDKIDLLSIQLKKIYLKKLETRLGLSDYFVDASEFWSLAKTSLKKAIQPSLDLDPGIYVLRRNGIKSQEVVLLCVEGATASSMSSQWIDLGPLQGNQIEFSPKDSNVSEWTCGAQTYFVKKEQDTSETKYEISSLVPQGKKIWKILAPIGITESISEFTLNFNLYWMKWVGGYQFKKVESVDLETTLRQELPKMDILMPLIDLPNANEFNFSLKAEEATQMIFNRYFEESGVEVELQLLLPPVKTQDLKERQKTQQGVRLNVDDLRPLMGGKGRAPSIIDLSCFSEKYLPTWTYLFAYPGSAKIPFILGSKAGHAAESELQILSKQNQMLGLIERLARGDAWRDYLKTGSSLENFLHWLGLIPEKGFQPITNQDKAFETLLDRNDALTIHLIESKSGYRQTYPPVP